MGNSRNLTVAEIKKLDGYHSVEAAKAVVADLWAKCCEFDGVNPKASFVRFSSENPFIKPYNVAMANYFAVSAPRSIRLV